MQLYTAFGMTGSRMWLARHFGVSPYKVVYRLQKGMTMEEALTMKQDEKEKVAIREAADKREAARKPRTNVHPWDMNGCSYLAQRAVLSAFRDYREMLMVERAFAKIAGRRSKQVQAKHDKVIRLAKRSYTHLAEDLAKGKSKQTLEDFVKGVLDRIQSNGQSAERFLLSDRLMIFTNIDGQAVLKEARRQAEEWAKGA